MIPGRQSPVAVGPDQRSRSLSARLREARRDPGMANIWAPVNKVKAHDGDTLDSGSGSAYSDLTGLESETDELGRRILQHQRDARRRIQVDSVEGIRKRRPMDGREGLEEALQSGGKAIGEGNDHEPPVTVPREWGRNGRRSAGWMRKIVAPSEPDDGPNEKPAFVPEMNPYSTRNLTADRNSHRPINSLSPPTIPAHGLATPSSMRHMNSTLHEGVIKDDRDFTDLSFFESTPSVSRYNRRRDSQPELDEDRKIERQSLTTRSLQQAGDTASRGTLRSAATKNLESNARRTTSPHDRASRRVYSPPRNKENVPLGGHVPGASKYHALESLESRTAQAVNFKKTHQAGHQREDALGLLRKLARVSSMSPSPARQLHTAGTTSDQEDKVVRRVPETTDTKDMDTVKDKKVRASSKEHILRHAQTQSVHDQDDLGRLPRSALEAIVREARRGDTSPKYGESTIVSLEDIVRPSLDPSDPTITFDNDGYQIDEDENGEKKHLLSQGENERRQEARAMEAMNRHLHAARSSIKDANRGLRRVENRIDIEPDKTATHQQPLRKSNEHTISKASYDPSQRSLWRTLWTEFRSLFYTWESAHNSTFLPSWPRPHPTPLGLLLIVAALWLVLELTLCWHYCHPLYASFMVDYGVDPDAPDFPFVIPTLVFRPFRWLWGPAYDGLAATTAVLWNMFSDDAGRRAAREKQWPLDGTATFPRDGNRVRKGAEAVFATAAWAGSAAKATATRIVQSMGDVVDEVGSMWDDEVWT